MNKANSSLETLVNEGLIGGDFAAILAEDKEEGATIVSILKSAIAATANAYEEAIRTNVPFNI